MCEDGDNYMILKFSRHTHRICIHKINPITAAVHTADSRFV